MRGPEEAKLHETGAFPSLRPTTHLQNEGLIEQQLNQNRSLQNPRIEMLPTPLNPIATVNDHQKQTIG